MEEDKKLKIINGYLQAIINILPSGFWSLPEAVCPLVILLLLKDNAAFAAVGGMSYQTCRLWW